MKRMKAMNKQIVLWQQSLFVKAEQRTQERPEDLPQQQRSEVESILADLLRDAAVNMRIYSGGNDDK
jgi:hypothetical protein